MDRDLYPIFHIEHHPSHLFLSQGIASPHVGTSDGPFLHERFESVRRWGYGSMLGNPKPRANRRTYRMSKNDLRGSVPKDDSMGLLAGLEHSNTSVLSCKKEAAGEEGWVGWWLKVFVCWLVSGHGWRCRHFAIDANMYTATNLISRMIFPTTHTTCTEIQSVIRVKLPR